MKLQQRYDEWFRKASELAREMNLEIYFTTTTSGGSFSTYEVPCVEVSALDTHEYLDIEGSVQF